MYFLLFTTFVLAANAVPLPPNGTFDSRSLTSRIIGGKNVSIESHPYQVSIQTREGHWCGGSIISSRHVLTATHCIAFVGDSPLIVRAGSSFHDEGGSLHRVEWNVTQDDLVHADIAVLRVTEPFVFDKTRQPVRLFNTNETAKPGTLATVTGWGVTGLTNRTSQLQAVEVPIVSRELCTEAYNSTVVGEIMDGQICAGYLGTGGKDACQGDSGGPLVIGGRQAGIVSLGLGCANPWYPGVYADVAYFRKWIAKYTGV